MQPASAVGVRGARQAAIILQRAFKARQRSLNLKPWAIGSHHRFLRGSVL